MDLSNVKKLRVKHTFHAESVSESNGMYRTITVMFQKGSYFDRLAKGDKFLNNQNGIEVKESVLSERPDSLVIEEVFYQEKEQESEAVKILSGLIEIVKERESRGIPVNVEYRAENTGIEEIPKSWNDGSHFPEYKDTGARRYEVNLEIGPDI